MNQSIKHTNNLCVFLIWGYNIYMDLAKIKKIKEIYNKAIADLKEIEKQRSKTVLKYMKLLDKEKIRQLQEELKK